MIGDNGKLAVQEMMLRWPERGTTVESQTVQGADTNRESSTNSP